MSLFNSNGFLCKKTTTPWGVIIEALGLEVEGQPQAPAEKDNFYPRRFTPDPRKTPKIQAQLWERILSLYHHYTFNENKINDRRSESLEVAVALSLNERTKQWDAHVFPQSVTSASVHGTRSKVISIMTGEESLYPPKGSVEAGSSHNHGCISSYFSSTDDGSEKTKPGIHIVVGSVQLNRESDIYIYSAVACLMWEQKRYYCPLSEIVELPESHKSYITNSNSVTVTVENTSDSEEVRELKKLARTLTSKASYTNDISVVECNRRYIQSYSYEPKLFNIDVLECVKKQDPVKKQMDLGLMSLSEIEWRDIALIVSLLNGYGFLLRGSGLDPDEPEFTADEILQGIYGEADDLTTAELLANEDPEVIRAYVLDRGAQDQTTPTDDADIDKILATLDNAPLLDAYVEWCLLNEIECPAVEQKLEKLGFETLGSSEREFRFSDYIEEEEWGVALNGEVDESDAAPIIRKVCQTLAELKAQDLPKDCSMLAVVYACLLHESMVTMKECRDLFGSDFSVASRLVGEANF